MKKILIIDDEPDILELLRNRLESHNYRVITACDGVEGVVKLDDERPDLIVIDLIMPRINGFTFVKIIKKYHEYKLIPLIVLTARSDAKDLFDDGDANFYLVKPFNSDDLVGKVGELLSV